ncbi:MAG: sigma-54-dependent Fis family transcriptional regulator [Deltaproteobacteria bacterium]|nr:sigma-54-dependent Fis family transcriptional regulator [Deltaproteobacteria bacterium]
MTDRSKILIVDDEAKMRRILQIILQSPEYDIDLATSGEEAWTKFQKNCYRIVLTDLKMQDMDGMELLRLISGKNPNVPVIVITAYGSVESAVSAMKNGAFDYITKPFEREEIRITVAKAIDFSRLKDENRYLREAIGRHYPFKSVIGNSQHIQTVRELAAKVAETASTVLIQGESGTGKELIAKVIHYNSPRAPRPFIAFNCGALPVNLLESELFGHEKGAYTGAYKQKPGRFELADSGSLFLDEIGDMSHELQVKMLRVLEERSFERLGDTKTRKVDVRVIAATNHNLADMVEKGTFRNDLFYRLNIFPINLRPLRERREDIPLLADHFVKKLSEAMGKQVWTISPEAMELLVAHNWPGNVRELQNALERAMILCSGREVTPGELLLDSRKTAHNISPEGFGIPGDGVSLEAIEKDLILMALKKANYNQSKAAQFLKISRNTMRYRMEKHGISLPGRYPPPGGGYGSRY